MEIDRLTPIDDLIGLDTVVEKVVVDFSFVSVNEKLSQEAGQYKLWTFFDMSRNFERQIEIYFDVTIQEYAVCMNIGGPIGQPVEYSIFAFNNCFNWEVKDVKKMN